ncbi:MAG TPA: hypothetical protein VF712_06065 [Thermoleophilaceae bacterium]
MRSANRGKALAALAIALSAAGCSRSDDAAVPVGCKEGPDSVRAALARAPARVELDGTPLSECFTRGSAGADLQQVGASYVTVAGRLADRARLEPDGPDALRLGYLVGAARRGASSTQGVHDELMRRIEQELTGLDTGTAAYRRGYRAGRDHG